MIMQIMCSIGSQVRMSGLRLLHLSLVVLVVLGGCQPMEGVPARTTVIRIAGASAMQPVLYDLTTAFNDRYPTVFFEVAGGGSTIGEERLFAGQIDLAASTLISPTTPSATMQNRRSEIGRAHV